MHFPFRGSYSSARKSTICTELALIPTDDKVTPLPSPAPGKPPKSPVRRNNDRPPPVQEDKGAESDGSAASMQVNLGGDPVRRSFIRREKHVFISPRYQKRGQERIKVSPLLSRTYA